MSNISVRGLDQIAQNRDLSSIPEIEEVFEKLPRESSIEIDVQKVKNSFVCELRCISTWGKFVARRVDLSLPTALGSACRSILRSIRFVRRSVMPPVEV